MNAVAEASPSIRRGTTSPRSGSTRWRPRCRTTCAWLSAGERDFCSALEEMTRVEVAAREARIVRQRIRSSGFPYVKGLADFDWTSSRASRGPASRSSRRSVHRARRERAARRQPGRGQDPPRRGHRHRGRAGGARGEVHGLRQARRGPPGRAGPRDPQEAPQVLRALEAARHRRARVPRHRRGRGRPALQLISTRYEQRSTIITTNVGIGGWGKVFGDDVAASAIADRVCHHCHVIKITGRSYRLKDLPRERRGTE